MRALHTFRESPNLSHCVLILGSIVLFMVSTSTGNCSETMAQDSTVSISGSVNYFRGDVPVDSVEMTLLGGVSDTAFTDADGNYQFAELQTGFDYSISPRREKNDECVTAYDAAFILQLLCNLTTFNHCDSVAADVTCSGIEPFNYDINAYDAAILLRYVVGYEVESCIADWIFEYHGDDVTQWYGHNMFWSSMDQSHLAEDWKAVIIGDVSGNWRQPAIPMDTAAVWLPDRSILPGEIFRVYITIGDVRDLNVFSAQFAIIYDESTLTVTEVGDEGTIYENFGVFNYRIDDGKILIAWAGHIPLEESGPLVYIDFQISPDAQIGQTNPLHFEYFMFNEGNPWAETTDGVITVISASDIAVSDTIHDFGQAVIGRIKDWVLTVSNVGIEDLIVSAIRSDTSVFTVSKTSFNLHPDGSEDVTVTFAPLFEGYFSGHFTISSNDPDESELLVSLHGTGVLPYQAIEVYPTSYDFGQVAVHGSIGKAFTVLNVGTESITIIDIVSSNLDFMMDKSTLDKIPFALKPESSEEVTVICSPAIEGPTSGNVTVYSNDPDESMVTVSVSATGVTPDAVVGVSDGSGAPGTAENVVSIYMDNSVEVGGMQLMVNFDPGVLTATRVSSTPRTAHLDVFDANVNYGPGRAKLLICSSGGAAISSGTGSVAEIYFDVDTGAPSGTYALTLTDVILGDLSGNRLLSGIENGQFFVQSQSQYTICGTVTYRETDTPVDSAQVILSGGATDTAYTDAVGFYQFNGLRAGLDYIVTPVMTNDDAPVTAYDASLILRALCGVYTLSDFDSVTADVTKDGTVSAFDAATILKYNVNRDFMPNHFIGSWSFIPDRLVYNSLSADQIHQSYEGCICGDVSGNWCQTAIPEDTVVVSVPECNAAPGESIRVCINFSDVGGLEVFSAQCAITYDRSTLTCVGIGCEGTIYGNIGVIEYFAIEDGHIFVAWAGNQPPEEDGTFVPLVFYVSPNAQIGQSCQLHFEYFLFNEGNPAAAVEDGAVNVTPSTGIIEGDRSHSLPSAFALSQNHPNPFNPSTDIRYRIADSRSPVHTTLKIYNVLGQEVSILVDGAKEAGFHTAHWNGRNTDGHVVPNGIYFYRLSIPGIQWSETRTMVLMK